MLFDNSLNDKRFQIDIRMENGYEEGCTWGSNRSQDQCDPLVFIIAPVSPTSGVQVKVTDADSAI